MSWATGRTPRPYAVLDDCHSRLEWPTGCMGQLVLVDGRVGLQDVDCERAKAYMMEGDLTEAVDLAEALGQALPDVDAEADVAVGRRMAERDRERTRRPIRRREERDDG